MASDRESEAVVDTNLMVSGLLFERGFPYLVVEAVRRGALKLLISPQLFDEYTRVLSRTTLFERYHVTPADIATLLDIIWTTARMVQLPATLPVAIRDPNDAMVLGTALAGHAAYLVTGDRDLLDLAGLPQLGNLRILSARGYVEQFGDRQ